MSAADQIKKAIGRTKARERGMVPDQRGRRMRDRIVKDAINPRALAVHSPRMRGIRRSRASASLEAKEREAHRRRWGHGRVKRSLWARIKRAVRTFIKGKGHR